MPLLKLEIVYHFLPALKQKDWKTIADKLDVEIEKIAKKLKFEFEGSGYNFKTKERDMSFVYKK